jgi:hypothetical protein
MSNPLINFVKDNFIDINEIELDKLKNTYSNEELLTYFGKLKLKFPYKKYYILDEISIEERLNIGKQYNPIFLNNTSYPNIDLKYPTETKKYNIKMLLLNTNLYEYDVISDHITESCRVKGTIKNNDSIYNHFKNKNLHNIWLNFDKIQKLNTKVLRDILYYNTTQTELTNFNPCVALGIYKKFKPKKILDMSSGWGDRLLAAITYDDLCNIDYYYGIDPNTCLFDKYNKIIELSKNPEKFVLINDMFENAQIDKTFDLMFSSPPYFNFEKYTTNENQSYVKYESVNKWLNEFMFVSIKKIYSLLNINGFMCINISDTGNEPYVYKILQFIEKMKEFQYFGTIGIKKVRSHKPVYIYKKIK